MMMSPTPSQSRAIARMIDQIDPTEAMLLQIAPFEQQLARLETYVPGQEKPMIDMPPPQPAVFQQQPPAAETWWGPKENYGIPKPPQPAPSLDPFLQFKPGDISPWDPEAMRPLGPTDVAQKAYNAGWRGDDLVKAVAISIAENRDSNPYALGDEDKVDEKWGPSVGLWQVRSLHDPSSGAWFDRAREKMALLDPQANANAAYDIQQARGWGDWSVTNPKSKNYYMNFMDQAREAVRSLGL